MGENLIVSLVVFIWLGVLSFFVFRFVWTFSKLTKGLSDKDLRFILEAILKKIEHQDKDTELIKQELVKIKTDDLSHVQKVGLIRYNPFSETGGNQSFVLALLDGNDCGLVITSLHSREATRVFTKPVKNAKESGYEFSKEEIQAIMIAKKSRG